MSGDPRRDGGISRRDALKASAVGCAGAVVSTAMTPGALSSNRTSIDQWESLVGQDFQVLQPLFVDWKLAKPINLQLVEAVETKVKTQPGCILPNHIPASSISLCFEADLRTNLPSATYEVSIPKIGKLKFFINEVFPGANAKVRMFEVILN